ncbi:esterase-like activity of phytase family protein [Merismopedia glauca]|uniref:Endonuclease/exonuclease/phosphatase n=1 Tax=Merismopedia glauca CCAP 1448/3 TaxID=1296344 RepID=A0A2T1C088_9CYAN|nr:esterase-like activity of phytase family protein [Merismopedia glauca]PSB01695.1 endonuclease/exonuclease/phosphatase [Merismopedia glauca CCAP 1448/3]
MSQIHYRITKDSSAKRRFSIFKSKWFQIFTIFLVAIVFNFGIFVRNTTSENIFLNLSLDFIGEYDLPKGKFENTTIGGLSGLTYDPEIDRFYAVSDDRGFGTPARFYTLKLVWDESSKTQVKLKKFEIEKVTFLTDRDGSYFSKGGTDTEGIALTPGKTLFISSEGDNNRNIPPFISEFDLSTGRKIQDLTLPHKYLPQFTTINGKQQLFNGIQNNVGFESLSISPDGEPFRIYAATESNLFQDRDIPELTRHEAKTEYQGGVRCRFLHYLVSNNSPTLIGEYIYQLDYAPFGAIKHGLADILALDGDGHFLTLERSAGILGFGIKLYQTVISDATDVSQFSTINNRGSSIKFMPKKLALKVNNLNIALDNLEGITFGPKLPDGSKSILLISDDNFRNAEKTQILLFRLVERSQ